MFLKKMLISKMLIPENSLERKKQQKFIKSEKMSFYGIHVNLLCKRSNKHTPHSKTSSFR